MVLEFLGPNANLLIALGIIVASVIVAKIFMVIFTRGILRMTAKTKTSLDELLVDAIRKPIYVAIILAGIFLSIDYVNFIDAYLTTIRQIFVVIWIFLGAYAVARIVKAFFMWYSKDLAEKTKSKTDDTLMPMLSKLVNALIYVIAIMVLLQSFGVAITPLLAGLGVGGLAIALALQGPMSNLFSGAFVISDKVVQAGDYIELDNGMKGYIEEVGWRSTRVKTLANNLVIIPNSKLAESIITNFYSPKEETSVIIQVGVAYGSDLDKVEQITKEVGKQVLGRVEGGVKDYDPLVRFHTFGDSNIEFSVILRAQNVINQYLIKHEFIKALKKRYDEEGITIEWPVRKIYSGDEKKD